MQKLVIIFILYLLLKNTFAESINKKIDLKIFNKEINKKIENLEKLNDIKYYDLKIILELANLYLESGLEKKAYLTYEKYIKLNPADLNIIEDTAYYYKKIKNNIKAIKYGELFYNKIDKTLKNKQRVLRITLMLLDIYYKNTYNKKFINLANDFLKNYPNEVIILKKRGTFYITLNKLNLAIKDYEKVFEYRKNEENVIRQLIELYKWTKNSKKAIKMYKHLIKIKYNDKKIIEEFKYYYQSLE